MKKIDKVSLLTRMKEILSVTPGSSVPLHKPLIVGNEMKYVGDCLNTSMVSSIGTYVDRFERDLASFVGANHAVATVNGTSALHSVLVTLGVQENDEILVPSLSFVATANAVRYCGAIPNFVDCDEHTLGVCPIKLEWYLEKICDISNKKCINKMTNRYIKAIIVTHICGHSNDIDAIINVCNKYSIQLIEDAAQSLGTYYKGIHTGNYGIMSIFSFNGNKIITTGGGGGLVTNNDELAIKAKHLTTTAKKTHKWEYEHDLVGYNYRMPNINAALGCAQLEQLPLFIQQKRKLAKLYIDILEDFDGISVFQEPNFSKSNYWLNTLIIDEQYIHEKDELLLFLNNNGIQSRPLWKPIHTLKMYSTCPRMPMDSVKKITSQVINTPSSVSLSL